MVCLSRRLFIAAAAATACPCGLLAAPQRSAKALLQAARSQIGVTLLYDPSYSVLPFPNGDVSRSKGVCTDVIIRAYRDAFGLDLQRLVHADMKAAFGRYPKRWGLKRPDRNIDHRRVPNLQVFLTRAGAEVRRRTSPPSYQPGDLFTAMIDGRLPHIGFISDRKTADRPWIIHNIGRGTREEDALFDYPHTGHYRWALSDPISPSAHS